MPAFENGLIFSADTEASGVHVILIGVSRYLHLDGGDDPASETYGLGQLDSAARTVRDLAECLLERRDLLTPTLKTMRVVVSPSSGEEVLEITNTDLGLCVPLKSLPRASAESARQAIRSWRTDASYDANDTAFFYFAGHGIQRSKGDAILLLDNLLASEEAFVENTIDTKNIYGGMNNPDKPNMARNQLYVIDACRGSLAKLKTFAKQESPPIFNVSDEGDEDKIAAVIYASSPGHLTFGSTAGISAFGSDFITCLKGGAGEFVDVVNGTPQWLLTLNDLFRVLGQLEAAFNAVHDASHRRRCQFDKFSAASLGSAFMRLPKAPRVKCSFTVGPPELATSTTISLSTAANQSAHAFPSPPLRLPYSFEIDAGYYVAAATLPADQTDWAHTPRFIEITPPNYTYEVRWNPTAGNGP